MNYVDIKYPTGRMVLGTAQTASGTAVDFTGIPSWVKRITVMIDGISTNGTSSLLVQIGSGSIDSTGYTSASSSGATTVASTTYTTGFGIRTTVAANTSRGTMTLYNFSDNIWVANFSFADLGGAFLIGGGSKTISGVLDRLRLTTVNGTDTFDAGSVNIMYEG